MLPFSHYQSAPHFDKHVSAWKRLDQAIEYEAKGEHKKAEMSLKLACRMELQALGFEPMNLQ